LSSAIFELRCPWLRIR